MLAALRSSGNESLRKYLGLIMRWISLSLLLVVSQSFGENHQLSDIDVNCLVASVIKLGHHPALIKQLQKYQAAEREPYESLDARWSMLPDEAPEIVAVLDNPSGRILKSFVMLTSLQGEGMLIGADGGLAAATSRTTDFWQGDEDQFLAISHSPRLDHHIIKAHPDESTDTVLIKVSVPVRNTAGELLGVVVIGFDAYVMQFRKLCAQ